MISKDGGLRDRDLSEMIYANDYGLDEKEYCLDNAWRGYFLISSEHGLNLG